MSELNIVGGGYSGVVFAIHAMERPNPPKLIRIFEPEDALGYGVAYKIDHPAFRLNVPCDVMKIQSELWPEFADWIDQGKASQTDFRAVLPDKRRFYKRRLFGDYIAETFIQAKEKFSGRVEHHQQTLNQLPEKQLTVLATGVGRPSRLTPHASAKIVVQQPYDLTPLSDIPTHKSVLIVGTGLTALDMVSFLSHKEHQGPIELISTRGSLPLIDVLKLDTHLDDLPNVETASAWVRTRRAYCDQHADGFAALSSVREELRNNWQHYPDAMKRAMIRHGMAMWNIHRFRASPQAMSHLLRLKQAGQLQISKRRYDPTDESADVLINCTGPRPTNPFHLPLDVVGESMGINFGYALKADNSVVGHPNLYALGAMVRSLYADVYGGPDIAWQAKRLATQLFG